MPKMDDTAFEDGKKLLEIMLPVARRKLETDRLTIMPMSQLGQSQMSYISEGNLSSVMIYPAPMGGWHADIVLKEVPAGVPNSLGTPPNSPVKTREEAKEIAIDLLTFILKISKENENKEKQPPVFLLYDLVFTLIPDVLNELVKEAPEMRKGYGSRETAIMRLEEALEALSPGGFNSDDFEKWDSARQGRLIAILHIAALSGLYRYPATTDASPSGHGNVSKTRH